jgi:hypothetical protein
MLTSWEELSELEQAQEIYSDMHKDAYGFRPRFDYSTWTLDKFNAQFETMSRIIEADNKVEKENQEKSAHDFEMRVLSLLQTGAKNRAMALRWIHEAEGSNGDDEYLCFLLGLSYGYFRKTGV